ncbi:WD repeat-containing protein 87 [Canis lupus familiaris]|uniref:WD repeat-containing protein 87 n=1 Tax=Canis lupus familiaris TaxID=9615 RepID=UPI0018F6843E|nr:WD repeat-containing protein 87 [Canis lupus familiaris]
MGGIIEKMNFPVMDQVPPVETMVHTGSSHMLIAYCGDVRLRLFGDHHRAFISLGTVPCRFSISCLCYDSETDILLSGTLGAVVTWLIIPNGRGLQMAQIMPMPDHELVQGFSLNGPHGSLLAFCENMVRVFTHQGQGQLKEVKKFTPIASGSSITCSFTCVSQGSFYAGNKDGEIHAWGLDQGNFLHSFQAHSSSVICVHSRPETYTLLTAGQEGVVKEWNLAFGNLLRQLNIDEDLQRLQFIDNTTFFCQTTHTFSLHHLPYFYSLFNVCGSAPEKVQRVCCGHNWTRILCATKDGLLRFLSPVTGDLLVITWPLLIMDKAMAWAYDSDKEELFVATGSSEVLVFDATHSPCTAKYLVCTSVNSRDRVRCLAYGQSHLGMGLGGLMFCGHDSGIVRILSHYSYARIEKTVHSGAVLALSTLEGPQEISLLCSYGMDHTLYLTEAVLQKNKVILQPINKILCACALTHVILLPGSVGAITENHCWRLWHYQDFLKSSESKQSSVFKETKCLHQCAITSFDVCYSLKLFVTGGIDGSVRIWDFHGRLITELDSALDFGPLCFANNRGDLLLTFNQSLYLVSCLNLLPPTQLIHLANLSSADDIQEVPKPFLPSFFLSFERIFVPKFVYLGQGLQELQGLEALLNKRVIAFDNTVPHVVEEERHMSTVIQVEPKLYFSGDKNIAFDPKHNSTPHMVPAQLQLADWDGLNSYHMLHCFFGKGQQWPFAPDGYIPNSVIRARLWPDGTPIFLRYDLYQDKDWDMTKLVRSLTLSPVTLLEENVSMKKEDKSKKWKKTFYDILVSMINQNWTGRKFDEELINHLIEAILNLTIYCSVDQYKTYITVLAQIFATYQVSSRLCYEAACRLMEDTVHPNPCIRELAWEGLERLGILSHLFAVPLAIGLMDSDENVRAKALHLMIRVTGIQTKTMLVGLLSKEETFREMQQEFIGEASLDQLLGIQAKDIQCLLTQVKQRLNENLTLSYRDQQPTFHSDISMAGEPEMLVKRIVVPEKITKPKERMTHVQAKRRQLIKKELRVSRKPIQTKFVKFSSVLVPSEDKDEQREARRSEQIDTQHVALEPELPLSTFSPAKYQEDAESKEVMVEATEEGIGHMAITEIMTAIDQCGMKDYEEVFPKVERHEVEGGGHMEVTEFMKAMGQHGNKDYGEVFPKMEKYEFMNRLWKRAVKRGYEKVAAKLKQEKDLKDISETIVEETKEKGMQITEEEIDTRKKHGKSGRGLAGMPGRIGRLDTRSWRDDICYLVTSRIASSCPGMLRDLGQELVDLAQVMLAPQDPSWDLFQEICPLLKDSSELHEKVVEEPFIITEKVDTEVVEEERTELGGQRGKKALKDKAFSQVKKKKDAFLDKLVLEKRKFKKEARKLGRQERKIAEEERKLSKTEKKLMQRKEKLTQDRKKLTHQKEKIPWDEKIVASPQEKLTSKEEQKLVLGGKKETGKGGKLLRERKRVTQKKGRAALKRGKWDWEKIMMAHEEGMWCQEEGLPTWGERKLSQEEEELGDEEEELGDEEEEDEEEEEAEMEKIEKREKEEEERQKDAESRLMKVIRSEERVLKTKLSKEEVSLSKLAIEDKALAEKREGITRREMPFTKERLLDGKRYPTLRDKVMWPTVLKSPFKIPLPGAPEKERMPLKVLGVHLDLKGQESPLLGAHPMTSSWGRQEDVLLEKAKSMGTGLETQIPEGLHRLESHLSDIMKPQRREHRSKGKKWKRFFKYQDSPVGKTEGQVPGPAPALAPSLTSIPAKRPCHSEASFSDEDWITNALIRLEAGEQLSRDSFHRLHQHLRDFTSKGYLKWMHRCSLKAIAKHLRQNLEVSHTDISQPSKDVWSPVHLKVIPPIRRKQKESWLEPLSIVEPVLPSATRRSQTPEALNWHLLAESQRKKQAQQLSSAMKEIPHLYPIRKHIPTTVYPSVGKKSLDLIFQKDLQALRYKGGLPKFHMAKREALPIPSPVLPSTTKRIRVPKANLHWHLLGEPYRSARVQQLSKALREMEMKHFYPAAREIFTGAHASVDKQTLALMFQKDLGAFKGKDRPLMLPKLKKAQTTSKKKEEVPQWETFVALYYVLQMLQQRYAKDSTAWMEQFYRLMDLYQFKSPQIQRLLLELLHREELQPREIMYQKALKTQELVPGERLFCGLFCGHSHVPAGPLKFQNVVPLPGKSRVHTIQPVGIAQYGFLELAWKNLPQVNSYLIERLPNIPTPTL